ncbi:GNAT family N-acetyltransferase [Agromyces sp. NPDC056965]|uniref:GNAT family N-acetyltransferase n=1 Tax=Agromyces sp. NPDC056965 TaxID=3345983 RepID=UPI003642F9D5
MVVQKVTAFEAEPRSPDAFFASKPAALRWVTVDADDVILAWAAAGPVSSRPVCAGVAEHSIYVDAGVRGLGVGRALLDHFIERSEAAGIWTLQSSIFPENVASLALHERLGFRRIGVRERIALMSYGPHAGAWRDTILLERRSMVAG